MGLRIKPLPYTYNPSHDLNDVIRQYNGLTKGHSKIKQLRVEFEQLNDFPLKHHTTIKIPVLTVALHLHKNAFVLEDVEPAITTEIPTHTQSNNKIINTGNTHNTQIKQHLGVTSTVHEQYKPPIEPDTKPQPKTPVIPSVLPNNKQKNIPLSNKQHQDVKQKNNDDKNNITEIRQHNNQKTKLKPSYETPYNNLLGTEIRKGYVLRNGNLFKIVDQTQGISETPVPILTLDNKPNEKRKRRKFR